MSAPNPIPVLPPGGVIDPNAISSGVLGFIIFMCVGVVIIIGVAAYMVRDR